MGESSEDYKIVGGVVHIDLTDKAPMTESGARTLANMFLTETGLSRILLDYVAPCGHCDSVEVGKE